MLFKIAKANTKMKVVKFTMGFAAIIAASLAMYAFTPSAPKPKADAQWYSFNGSTPADQSNPAKYSPITGVPDCDGNSSLCAINARPDVNGQPDLTTIDDSKLKD